jgi:hypothetical protein
MRQYAPIGVQAGQADPGIADNLASFYAQHSG